MVLVAVHRVAHLAVDLVDREIDLDYRGNHFADRDDRLVEHFGGHRVEHHGGHRVVRHGGHRVVRHGGHRVVHHGGHRVVHHGGHRVELAGHAVRVLYEALELDPIALLAPVFRLPVELLMICERGIHEVHVPVLRLGRLGLQPFVGGGTANKK